MAKQTFTTGQVLTAAQMTSLQQTAMGGGSATAKTSSYVLVAADAGTTVAMNAAGATTITVNTALFAAGDTVYIQNLGVGVSTITAGTATVNTASSLALAQYEGGQLYFTSASASIFLKGGGAAAGGGGKVLQVVSGTYSTQTTAATSATYGDSGLSLSITPTLNTSKVLVIIAQQMYTTMISGANTSIRAKVKLVRESTDIYTSNAGITVGGASSSSIAAGSNISIVYLDSPATTSSTTYKTQGAAAFDSNELAQFQRDGSTSTITLLEIGA